mmetsp:Transcript_9072/g.22534  ORF Transcript_9072/g.22534 Transcript_9072/m.22534 type:complete len:242 (+) Transcript_9072:3-728(+)
MTEGGPLDRLPAMVSTSLAAMQEMRRDMLLPSETLMQCMSDVAQVHEMMENVRHRCECRVSQSTLEQNALMELHELYHAVLFETHAMARLPPQVMAGLPAHQVAAQALMNERMAQLPWSNEPSTLAHHSNSLFASPHCAGACLHAGMSYSSHLPAHNQFVDTGPSLLESVEGASAMITSPRLALDPSTRAHLTKLPFAQGIVTFDGVRDPDSPTLHRHCPPADHACAGDKQSSTNTESTMS